MSKSLNLFFKVYLLVFVAALTTLFFIEQGDIVLLVNRWHLHGFDTFFSLSTHLGDGLMLIPLLIISLFVSKYHSLLLLMIACLQGATSYILKKIVFAGSLRPKGYFSQDIIDTLHFIPGVTVHTSNSFPSGHTLSAFSYAVFICLLFPKQKWVGLLACFLGCLVGLSRVFLVQHFWVDITYGSLVGVIVSYGAHWVLSKSIKPALLAKYLGSPVIKL